MNKLILKNLFGTRFWQFVKFCIVGASGLFLDMAALHFFAKELSWNVSLSKFCSAELALMSNFLFNEAWTFRGVAGISNSRRWGSLRRLVKFQAICGAGVVFAVVLLNLFYQHFGFNLYASNAMAIALVTLWNFWMNAIFNWRSARQAPTSPMSMIGN